jgi:hypothetical protein
MSISGSCCMDGAAWAPLHPKTQLVIDPVRRVRRLAVVAQRAAMG